MDLKVVTLSVLVLFLCPDVSGYRVQKREAQEKSTFAQIQETAQGYWDQFKNKTQEFNMKARETGKKVTEVMSTYTTVLWDQFYGWWSDL